MKKFTIPLFLFVFTFVMNAFLCAQNNIQQDLDNMYRERENYYRAQDSLAEVERAKAEVERAKAEVERTMKNRILLDQQRKLEEDRQRVWDHITGNDKNGPIMGPIVVPTVGLDRMKVKRALTGIVNLDTILDSISISKYYNAVKYFSGSAYYVAETLNTKLTTKNPEYLDDTVYQNGKKVMLKGIDAMRIYPGPFFLALTNEGNWVLVDSQYKVHKSIDVNSVIPYSPIAKERQDALTELGFSKETIRKYATDNPWNLVTFIACDNFDGHDLVEKVAVAWRYSTIANNKEKKGETPNHKKQYRFVYIKKDGEEREEIPKDSQDLPPCLDFNKRKRDPFYKSDTQPVPPNYGKFVGKKQIDVGSGCSILRAYSEEQGFYPKQSSLIELNDQWFF